MATYIILRDSWLTKINQLHIRLFFSSKLANENVDCAILYNSFWIAIYVSDSPVAHWLATRTFEIATFTTYAAHGGSIPHGTVLQFSFYILNRTYYRGRLNYLFYNNNIVSLPVLCNKDTWLDHISLQCTVWPMHTYVTCVRIP